MKNKKKVKINRLQGVLNKKHQVMTVLALALVLVVVLLASYGVMEITERRAHSSAEKLVSDVVDRIDTKMNEVRTATREIAETAHQCLNDPDAVELLPEKFVSENAFILGSTIAYEPDYFPERWRCFAPYSWKTSDGAVHVRQLGTETDYYEEEWYAEAKRTGLEYWCEPYFDEGGAKIMMCTFSIPLMDSTGKLAAVLTADVGLDDLEEYISSITPYPDSYIVLRSKKGTILANEDMDDASGNDTIIKGMTEIGWSVELTIPFTYLMHGDSGIFFIIGIIFLLCIIFIYFVNRLLQRLQERSASEYMNVIDAISSSFSSIYLVDLNTDMTLTFRDPENYADVIRSMTDENSTFYAKFSKLIQYDVYGPDRDMLLNEITSKTIQERLASQDRYETRFRKKAGGLLWYEMHVFVMKRSASGTAEKAVIAFTDVNESVLREKETQETLEHALAMAETANQAKTSFLFNMSHDIRTPMNAIIGFTNMAMKHIDDKERVADSLSKMQTAGELLLSLINDILDMSRIESGVINLDENEGDVYLSFSNIQSTMEELANAKDIVLSFEFGHITDRYVYADFSRCIRVFINIITNAIKYTKPGGFVRVSCEQTGKNNGYGLYRYTFTDNGIGMSEEFQKHVFDEFTREESTTVSGIQGTGLGLAVCRSFVTAMKGTIECTSKQGEGSTFIVTLPFRLQEGTSYTDPQTGQIISSDASVTVSTGFDFSGRKVLLVEDNALNREIAEDILTEEGLTVESASDGSLAVKLMNEKGPGYFDFILMDIQMPIMDGYEATKLIREMYPKDNIPIIALSANAFEEDKLKSIAAGMNDHVAKPIDIAALRAVLAKYA